MADGEYRGQSDGPATDRHNEPVIDPTKNVLDLVQAAISRQDDLRNAEIKHLRDTIDYLVAMREELRGEVDRDIAAAREHADAKWGAVDERLKGIDRATELRLTGIDEIPTRIDEKVANLAQLTDERFESIAIQFKERDTRQEREARDNKVAVDAAFAAQKEAAAKQDESNAKAIDKSEKATAETIKTNQELAKATTDSLTKSLDETKVALARVESVKQGQIESRTEGRAAMSAGTAVLAAVVGIIVLGLMFYAAFHRTSTTLVPGQVVTVTTPTGTVP